MKISYEEFCKKIIKKDKKIGSLAAMLVMATRQKFINNIDNSIDLDELEKYMPGITKEILEEGEKWEK